ncbi:hypothetical protein AYI73_04570 [Shewanella algae]|nr:hypothetical protein AYI73_04570 [Shewanella algae]
MLSVISLMQQLLDIGLNGVFLDFLQYYRALLSEVIGLLHLELPQPLLDLWTLSFIGAGAHVRTEGVEHIRLFREYKSLTTFRYWKAVYFFFLGVTFIGCSFFTAIISPFTYVDEMNQESQVVLRRTIVNSFIVISGMLLFFALNAYAPSL